MRTKSRPQGKRAPQVADLPIIIEDFHYAVRRRDVSVFRRARLNFEARYCHWRNQSEDGKKWKADGGRDPFPWPGASDARVRLIDKYIREDVAILKAAWRRHRVTVTANDPARKAAKANRHTQVLRWMLYTQMPELEDEIELGANIMLERGSTVLGVTWNRENQLGYDNLDYETLKNLANDTREYARMANGLGEKEQAVIDLPAMVMDPSREKAAADALAHLYPDVRTERLTKMVQELRTQGATRFPRPYLVKDRPEWTFYTPNENIFIPPEAVDIQKASAIHYRELLSEADLADRPRARGWDESFVKEMIEKRRGQITGDIDGNTIRLTRNSIFNVLNTERLFEVVHSYRRVADDDGVPGIWYTCYNPGLPDVVGCHALLDYDHGQQPFTWISTEKRTRLLDEARGYGELGATWQNQMKAEWDSRIDRASIATLPPSYYPPGEEPDSWGPGVQIGTARPDDYGFLEAPRYDMGSRDVEASVREFADEFFARVTREGANQVEAGALRQLLVERFLSGICCGERQTLELMQQFSKDEFYYRIVGDAKAEPLRATREDIQGQFDVTVSYDASNLDPEAKKQKVELLQEAIQLDTTGRIDRDETLTVLFELIDPSLGERVLRAPQDAAQAEIDDEDTCFAKISAGLQVDIRPGQAYQLRMQRLQNILQTNQLAQLRYQKDPQFKEAIDRRMQQFTFQMQQQQNAVTGRFLGTQTQEAEGMSQMMKPAEGGAGV